MTYNIPDSLLPYLEYIPEDMLAGIVTDALTALIFSDKCSAQSNAQPQFDVSQILEQIQGMISEKSPEIKPVKKLEKSPEPVVQFNTMTASDDVDDDCKDAVDDFMGQLFK